MKKVIELSFIFIPTLGFAQSWDGFPDIPATGVGNATAVVLYSPGPGVVAPYNVPENALGYPDEASPSLGRSGELVLSTAPMIITGDKTETADFYVYEATNPESWDTYVSTDNETWVKLASVWSAQNSRGTVKGYDVDSILSGGSFPYVKLVDTSNSSGNDSAGADINAIVIANAQYTGKGTIVDTDSRNGMVFNLEKDESTGAVNVKRINKDGSVQYINYSTDDSLEPVALSVQGNFDCDDEKDINVLLTRKNDGVPLNIIKDLQGNDIKTIDNSVTK
ncbi:cell envelope biogenesis protein OmpA [Salmonella enterica subsp. enterica]|nr:cell envelope biogenesis protein OmpA [Salmonella enterica subsp. enterica serovar Mikawasima]EDN7229202.1 cell envelope biogenesis protein OmpA [Salmonella enterica subsp. enterica serovar Mikawasima]